MAMVQIGQDMAAAASLSTYFAVRLADPYGLYAVFALILCAIGYAMWVLPEAQRLQMQRG